MTGCSSDEQLSRLDHEAQQILRDQEQRSLGQDHPDTQLTPGSNASGVAAISGLYDKEPATTNTPAGQLPATNAPPLETVPYPTILDDGSQPDTLRLDLEKLLALGIAQAPDYRRAREDLFLTTLRLIVERHLWGPRFFSSVTGLVNGDPEEGDYDTAANLIGSLGVTQRLPYGGSVSAEALVSYVRLLERSALNDDPGEAQTAEVRVRLDLPLLRGAGRTADTVEARIQAERDLTYAVRRFERFRREFFVDLATTYFDLLRRQRQLVNQGLQLDNLRNASKLFKALAEAGREPYFRAFRAEQRMIRAQNALVNQREAYVRAVDQLKLRLGIDTMRPVEIIPVDIEVPIVLLDLEASVLTAMRERLDLQNEADAIDDSKRGVLIAKNRLLPDLDLTADTALPTDDSRDFAGVNLEPRDTTYAAALTLRLPLDRKIQYTDYRAALIDLERAERTFLTERDRVALQVRQAVRAIEESRYLVEIQKRAVEINERRAKQIEINARDLGPTEVIDVQEDLLAARNDRDTAQSNLRISILQYLLATGQIRVDERGRWRSPGTLTALDPVPLPMVPALPAVPPDPAAPDEPPADAEPMNTPEVSRVPGGAPIATDPPL